MTGVNQIILVGHLGRAPDVRRTGDGASVVLLSLATSESWHDKMSGERRERTEWHKVVIFNEELGKIAGQHLKKGSKVYVEGKVRSREYEKQRVTEIVLEPYRGQLQLLDRVERQAPSLDSYGSVTTRSSSHLAPSHRAVAQDAQRSRDAGRGSPQDRQLHNDDPRMAMGTASRMPLDEFGDDIPF